MFDLGQTPAQQHSGNKPVFIFCSLVKFTSYFIQRILLLYHVHTNTHRYAPTSIALLRISKKQVYKKLYANTLSVQSSGSEGFIFLSSGCRRSWKSKAQTSYGWSKFANNEIRSLQPVELWASLWTLLKGTWLTDSDTLLLLAVS